MEQTKGTVQDNTGMTYYVTPKVNIASKKLFDRIRERLKVTNKELTDSQIIQTLRLNNELIGDWIINNADGFKIKNNGVLIVSKYLPKYLRACKEETIETIMNLKDIPEYAKKLYLKRYNKTLKNNQAWQKGTPHLNLHSFFYGYKIMWFNKRNCAFDKAYLYEIEPTKKLNAKLANKIISGKDYYEFTFDDFIERKQDKKKVKK